MSSQGIPDTPAPESVRKNLNSPLPASLSSNMSANLRSSTALKRRPLSAASIPVLPSIAPPVLPPILPRRTPPVKLPGRYVPKLPREYPRPAYSERFHCIASECEDTCCKDWAVPIDQTTYEKYQSVEGLKPHLGTLIVLNTKRQTRSDYARISLGPRVLRADTAAVAALASLVRRELLEILHISAVPQLVEVQRWSRAMAQYAVGHADRQRRIKARLMELPGLHLVGNAYDGIGISDCIRLGRGAARKQSEIPIPS